MEGENEFGAGVETEQQERAVSENGPAGEPAEPRSQPGSFVERLKSLGYTFPDDYDDDQYVEEILPVLDSYLTDYEEFRKWKESAGKGEAKASEAKPASDSKGETKAAEKPTRPQLSEAAQRMIDAGLVKVDPKTGLYTTDDPRLESYAREANEATQWRRVRAQKLLEDPVNTLLQEGLKDLLDRQVSELRKEYEEKLKAELSRMRQESELDRFDWSQFYERDQSGEVLKKAGRPVLNERGRAYESAIQKVRGWGVTDRKRAHEAALELIANVKPAKPKGRSLAEKVGAARTNRVNGSLKNNTDDLPDVETIWNMYASQLE